MIFIWIFNAVMGAVLSRDGIVSIENGKHGRGALFMIIGIALILFSVVSVLGSIMTGQDLLKPPSFLR